jgi:hypothetical protein
MLRHFLCMRGRVFGKLTAVNVRWPRHNLTVLESAGDHGYVNRD